ncbi:MAG TPA: hypothetical protein IAB01_00830 [Candidatus Avidesulfovibrio excrementigallinarum]|nr:hypothetical protein [Candidatus Avidesulfovibrio excrementigallinarum]
MKKLNSRDPMWGSLLFSGSDVVAEMMAHMGYDFLVIDGEHALNSLPNMRSMVRAVQAAGTGCIPLVRVPTHNPDYLKQVLDGVGVETLMFPFVESREEARAIVDACLYPPHGKRGFAATVRPGWYGVFPDYLHAVTERLCLIVQIESEQAMKDIVHIGTTPGIHSVFLGLGDLAVALGVDKGLQDPDFRAYIQDALARCAAAGIFVGSFQFFTDQAAWFLEQGGRYVSFCSDMCYISKTGRSDLHTLRQLVQNPLNVKESL